MGVLALTDAFVYIHGHDFTGDSNDVELTTDGAALDATTFGSGGWKELAGGVKSGALDLAGFWQAGGGQVDPVLYGDLGVAPVPYTIGPVEGAGQPAFMFRGGHFNYQVFGSHGELAPFQVTSQVSDGQSGVVRGYLAKARGNVSAQGHFGPAMSLGAPGASQYVYAVIHVFSAGTSIDVSLVSDDNSGMSSATGRGDFPTISAAGGYWLTRVAGPITDTYWSLYINAITGTFNVAGAVGIGS